MKSLKLCSKLLFFAGIANAALADFSDLRESVSVPSSKVRKVGAFPDAALTFSGGGFSVTIDDQTHPVCSIKGFSRDMSSVDFQAFLDAGNGVLLSMLPGDQFIVESKENLLGGMMPRRGGGGSGRGDDRDAEIRALKAEKRAAELEAELARRGSRGGGSKKSGGGKKAGIPGFIDVVGGAPVHTRDGSYFRRPCTQDPTPDGLIAGTKVFDMRTGLYEGVHPVTGVPFSYKLLSFNMLSGKMPKHVENGRPYRRPADGMLAGTKRFDPKTGIYHGIHPVWKTEFTYTI